jgi:hypothetical protein
MLARRTLVLSALVSSALALANGGCTPPTRADKLTDAAYDMNMATRFGRMDVAMSYVGEKSRRKFLDMHAGWGRGIRISDLEFAGLDMPKEGEAIVLVHVSWQRVDESTLRTTSIKQKWIDHEDHGWLIAEEARVGGEPGLLGEPRDAAIMQSARGAPGGEGEWVPGPSGDTRSDAEKAKDPAPAPAAAPAKKPTSHFSTTVIPADESAMD